ncbi:MAG: pyruvate formate-lyase activating enzyme, pyruvate formate lyase activating enzyme [Candidatus Peregrinibacteria bacterium GW2011_GWE2_39_6]|nr:MAG: pyruvate formate-lyase activating enzyme, pyruvate formate lyase activating enzyme [Candidatus Peregrinibacteria bacterium GW2011_GWE2_39_6]
MSRKKSLLKLFSLSLSLLALFFIGQYLFFKKPLFLSKRTLDFSSASTKIVLLDNEAVFYVSTRAQNVESFLQEQKIKVENHDEIFPEKNTALYSGMHIRINHSIPFEIKVDGKTIKNQSSLLGRIHSFESFGTLDGPGLRFVVFLEGCPLRCLYCHNVDMLDMKNYKEMTPQELLKIVLPYKPYFNSAKGGVTVSGGDPIMQPRFVVEFFKLCQKNKIHTTIDTSCFTTNKEHLEQLLPVTDLWMISLKHFDDKKHRALTGVTNAPILENIHYLSKRKARLWFRYLILPGWTDTWSNLRALCAFLRTVDFELIELLPYHTHGRFKWDKLGLPYKLNGIKPPTLNSCHKIKEMLKKEGYKVILNE